jgi:hypothetical protein
MKPITYKPNQDCEGGMEVHRYGKYVSVKEYNALKAKADRLEKAGDAVVATYVSKHFINEPAIRDWRAAKV